MTFIQDFTHETVKILTPVVKDWIIIVFVPSMLIIIGVLFNNFLRGVTKKTEQILEKLYYMELDDTARDLALNELLPRNGTGYLEKKKYYRDNLTPAELLSAAKK